MEGLLVELVKSLAAQGAAYTLLAIVGAALAYVTNLWIKAKNECFELSSTLNEKRITERSETISVLHAGAQANLKLSESIAVRTETLNNLIVVVTSGNERLERLLAEILRRVEENKAAFKEGRRVAAD
jgi:hypothetical protein